MAGLTSLFGMGRGEHRRQYHHKVVRLFDLVDSREYLVDSREGYSLTNYYVLITTYPDKISRHIGIAISLSIVRYKKD